MVEVITVPHNMTSVWLYYETGFEQLHPHPYIIDWMREQGYEYGVDWDVLKIHGRNYYIEFLNPEIVSLFVVKWTS